MIWDPHPQDGTGRGLVKKKTWGVLMPIDQEVKPVGDEELGAEAALICRDDLDIGMRPGDIAKKNRVPLQFVKDVQKEKFGTTAFLIKRYFKKNSSASGHITDSGLRPRVPVYLDGGWIRLIDGMVEVHPDNKRFPTKEFASEREALNYLANSTVATDSGLRPKDIKRGPGAFTVQLTDPDGREHTEPVSSLRVYDSANDPGEYEVVWVDRSYKTQRKVFKTDPQGPGENALHRARAFAKKLEDKDKKDPYGNIRGGVSVRATDAVSVETLQKKLDAAEKRLQNVRDAISMATYRRTNKGQRIQSSAEMTARGKFNDASSAVREAKAALEAVGSKATDGLLSNTAMLLAALYAWYRSRMDAPALQPRNYDLTTYTPRQRLLDSVDLAREKRIRALGKIEPHRYETPKPGSASLPCKKCGLSYWAAEHSTK
jgi:hypothetical protein